MWGYSINAEKNVLWWFTCQTNLISFKCIKIHPKRVPSYHKKIYAYLFCACFHACELIQNQKRVKYRKLKSYKYNVSQFHCWAHSSAVCCVFSVNVVRIYDVITTTHFNTLMYRCARSECMNNMKNKMLLERNGDYFDAVSFF